METLLVVIPYYIGVALGIGFMYYIDNPTNKKDHYEFLVDAITMAMWMTIILILCWLFTYL